VVARKRGLPLDGMSLDTYVTRMTRAADAMMQATYPEDGIFLHGLFLEGARWTDEEESAELLYTVGNTVCAGHLTESRLKQLLCPLPVMYVRAVPVEAHWIPEAVGYLRKHPQLYECPVYLTRARGPTFVFLSVLKTSDKDPVSRWILAGVAVIMQSDD
jgi:dynein heavy chain, axonemal